MTLPGPTTDSWFEYFDSAAPPHAGGTTFTYATPLAVAAVFGRTGTLLPLHVSTPLGLVPHGDESWATALTLLLHTPRLGHKIGARVVNEFGSVKGTTVSCAFEREGNSTIASLKCSVAPYARDVILVIRGVQVSRSFSAAVAYGQQSLRLIPRTSEGLARHPESFKPLAVSWDAAGPSPVHPVPGLREHLTESAKNQARTWSYSQSMAFSAGSDAFHTVPELVVRLGSVRDGARVQLLGFQDSQS